MAELLVKYFEETTFGVGDIVVVQEDGFEWGTEEHPATASNPHFFICKIPGMLVSEILPYLETIYNGDDWSDPENVPDMVHKRRFNFDNIKIPQPLKNEIMATEEITITSTQFYNFLNDKVAV